MSKTKKSKDSVAVSPRISQTSADFYELMFDSRNQGATFALEVLPAIYASTMADLKGRFTIGELGMILDVLNGHGTILCYGSPGLVGQSISLSMFDSFRLYPGMYEEKWMVSEEETMDKLYKCSRIELICLEIWAAGFWSGNYEEKELSEWCQPLL